MLKAKLFDKSAKPKGDFDLPPEYDGNVNKVVLYHAVRSFLANQRQGNASTKTRSEVSGGRKKPWKQKGTGRARQGSTRASHWRGGGIVFGPKPRGYRIELPKKVRRLARSSALNARAGEGNLVVVQKLEFDEPKTRKLAQVLEKLGAAGNVLILTAGLNENVLLSGRNLPRVRICRYQDANAYDVLWSDTIVIERDALEAPGAAGSRKSSGSAEKEAD